MPGPVRLLYRFNGDVLSANREGNRITLDVKNWRPIAFSATTTVHADAIMALEGNGATLQRLAEIAGTSGDATSAAEALHYYIERLAYARLLSWSLADDDGEIAQVEAQAKRYAPRSDALPSDDLQLSRFAFVRVVDSQAVLESGLVSARVTLGERGVELLAGVLGRPKRATPDSLAEALWRLGFVDAGQAGETDAARSWEFHDLLMHETSRSNREVLPIGGTYRLEGEISPPPAVRPSLPGKSIALAKIDPGRIRRDSAALDDLQARRRSVRQYSSASISLAAIGEFLWRCCRTTGHLHGHAHELISRPYPAGGSVNELEFYVAVERCEALDAAVYHYDSHGHALTELAASRPAARKIVNACSRSMVQDVGQLPPAATIVISTRLPRLAWKYERMAYRASLMNVGVVYHLMYMVATDMGLAPCAIGTGDSRLLEDVAGLDRLEEAAIGEFALGVPADDRPDAAS